MSMQQEDFSIDQIMKTSSLLQECDNQENALLKKYYNYKLTDWLQA